MIKTSGLTAKDLEKFTPPKPPAGECAKIIRKNDLDGLYLYYIPVDCEGTAWRKVWRYRIRKP